MSIGRCDTASWSALCSQTAKVRILCDPGEKGSAMTVHALLGCADVSIEQIQADSDKAVAASEQVLKESNPGELATQWRASDPMQADKNE